MTEYVVTTKRGDIISVEAESYESAAQIAVKRLNPMQRGSLVARRTTGTAGLSGWFQGYVDWDGGLSSYGPAFHLY